MDGSVDSASKVPATLELRIHGIRNTPPHELLRSGNRSLKPDDVELAWGDELAGFYRAKPEAGAGAGAVASGTAGNGGSPRVVEAYSWGRLARFTGVGMAGRIADAAVRTAWFLLMPFGLTNAAYWSRPLPAVKQQAGADPMSGQAEPRIDYAVEMPRGRDGAGRIRLFALVLTLYFVVTAAVVSMDLIAVQCFPADVPDQERRVCSALPAFLDGLAGWTRGQRIVLLALIPVVAVAVLAAIAYLARTRFHPRPNLGDGAPMVAGTSGEEISALPTLMIRNLWEARKEIRYNGWLHVWASLAAVGAIIAWDGLWTRIDGVACGSVGTFFTECVPLAPGRIGLDGILMMAAWLVAAGAVVLAGIETVRKSSDNPDMPSRDGSSRMGAIAGGAIISVLAAGLAAVLSGAPDGGVPGAARMLGLGTAPAGLMFVMLVLILTMSWLRRQGYDERTLGWRGKGSAVFSTLALGSATILSCAIVGAAATVLQRNLERRAATDDGMWRFGSVAGDVLIPPSVFSLFSGLLLAVIVAGAVAWGVCTWRALRSMTWNTQEAAVSELLSAYDAVPPLPQQEAAGRKLVAARRTASLAHRAEAVVSLLAILIFLGLLSALILGTFKDWWNTGAVAGLYGLIESMGVLGLAAAGATIVALAVMSAKPNSRPLALLWDLMCFMPKTAHPFGPPSYGERAVPEFAARIAAWLDGADGAPQPAKTGMVAISAHSLGAVIAVSALFHLKSTRPDLPFNRIGLLTYGTQLRSYFGRFFPELLGPAVLATAPVARIKLTAAGSPDDERIVTGDPSVQFEVNLSHILGAGAHRWVNLYRKTDYLGFPVLYQGPGGAENIGTDPYAQEMDPFTYQFLVVSHSDYLQAPQYETSIAAVVNSLPAPGP
ncbi:hypothetical protein DQ354_01970 [Arthrobacter sp. AQ5-06]|nr:hypothetical protein DQ354_01970 [Arthrobacter sp. AQ5-06]